MDNPHGTPQRYFLKCRCVPCRSAYSQYVIRRRQEREAGRSGVVSASRARRHIEGWNFRKAAKVTGVSECTFSRIRTGKVTRILRTTEEAILAVTKRTIERRVPRKQYVLAGPTKRRLRILYQSGFSGLELGRRLGLAYTPRLKGKQVRLSNAMRIEEFYNRIMAA